MENSSFPITPPLKVEEGIIILREKKIFSLKLLFAVNYLNKSQNYIRDKSLYANKTLPAGLEPAIPGLEDQCLIHWATRVFSAISKKEAILVKLKVQYATP